MAPSATHPLVCIAGKQKIAVDAAEHVRSTFPDLPLCVAPTCGDTGHDTWQPSLRKWAAFHSIPTATLPELHACRSLFFISLQFDQILRPSSFQTSHLYNIHFSHLPEYKGMYTAIWPLLDGRNFSGVTLHCIDAGIDTGDIIAQQKIPIGPELTSRELYLQCVEAGTRLFRQWFPHLLSGDFVRTPQTPARSTYRSRHSIDFTNLSIDLNQTAEAIHNQIRAFIFPEYQLPCVLGHPISSSQILSQRSSGKPGRLLRETATSVEITTIDFDLSLEVDPLESFIRSVSSGDTGLAQLHLDRIADLEGRNSKGWTPLMIAAFHARTDLVTTLLNRGADPNATNWNGTSVLMYAKSGAVRSGDITALSHLLASGVDPRHCDHSGRNVLDYARGDGANAVLMEIERHWPA